MLSAWGFGRRKLRLFACACCRAISRLLRDARALAALEVCERIAEGAAAGEERSEARRSAQLAAQTRGTGLRITVPKSERRAASAVYHALARDEEEAANNTPSMAEEAVAWSAGGDAALGSEVTRGEQAGLLRDIVGNPYRPALVDPAWLTWGGGVVSRLARAAYDDRLLPSGHLDQTRLGVLSDALEEAGCTDADILSHLRSAGPHVRGCWVLDLILGLK